MAVVGEMVATPSSSSRKAGADVRANAVVRVVIAGAQNRNVKIDRVFRRTELAALLGITLHDVERLLDEPELRRLPHAALGAAMDQGWEPVVLVVWTQPSKGYPRVSETAQDADGRLVRNTVHSGVVMVRGGERRIHYLRGTAVPKAVMFDPVSTGVFVVQTIKAWSEMLTADGVLGHALDVSALPVHVRPVTAVRYVPQDYCFETAPYPLSSNSLALPLVREYRHIPWLIETWPESGFGSLNPKLPDLFVDLKTPYDKFQTVRFIPGTGNGTLTGRLLVDHHDGAPTEFTTNVGADMAAFNNLGFGSYLHAMADAHGLGVIERQRLAQQWDRFTVQGEPEPLEHIASAFVGAGVSGVCLHLGA